MKSKKYELYYFKIDNKLEVDFLIYKDDVVIPIEFKASDNTRSTSLNNYIKMFNPKYAIRISTKNFEFENNIKSNPLYAAFLIQEIRKNFNFFLFLVGFFTVRSGEEYERKRRQCWILFYNSSNSFI